MHQQQTASENIVQKGEIAHNEQILLFPQCFLLNQIIVSPFGHIFNIKLLFVIFIIRPSKTGRIMGSPVAGGRRPVLCPEHISKTTLARVMKFHGWIDLIQGECSVQES